MLTFVPMLEIIRHIEYLITEYDCVLIPGLGGFVLQDSPAHISTDGKYWYAPSRTIVFNPTLSHNDGVLASSIMKARHIDYHQALLLIERDTNTLRALLRNIGDCVTFGELGDFVITERGIIAFESKKSRFISLQSFGLGNLNVLPLRELTQTVPNKNNRSKRKEPNDDVIHFTIRRRIAQRIMAMAATILLLFAVSLPLTDQPINENMATLIPTEMIEATTITDCINNKAQNGEYLIVVSTLTNRESALLKLQEFHNKGISDPIFLHEDGKRVYLYTRSFINRKEAFIYLRNALDNNTPFSDAWVMQVKK